MKTDDDIPDLIDEDDDDDDNDDDDDDDDDDDADDDIHIVSPPRIAAKRPEYTPIRDYPPPISRLLARITIPC